MNDVLSRLPQPVVEAVRAAGGPPVALERLGGMSGGRVYRVRFDGGSLVLKASSTQRELLFYRRAAGVLRQHGVPAPALLWSARLDGSSWLLLEDIPHALPRQRWNADRELLGVLCRLHSATAGRLLELPDMFVPAWSVRLSEAMLSCFAAGVAAELRPRLGALQAASGRLFRPWCNISGDPNPANWGLRDDGTPVLFDWERFARGTPALDLAITVPGLGDVAAFERVATTYLGLWPQHAGALPWSAAELSRDMQLAKLWTVVELMGDHAAEATATTQPVVDYLVQHAPAWIGQVHEPAARAATDANQAREQEAAMQLLCAARRRSQ